MELYPGSEILFVGAKGRMEMEKVPQAGYNIQGLWISGIQRKLTVDNLSFPFKLISSLRKAGEIIKRFKPQVAVGVGGYASGPLLYRAAKMKIPCLIQEQNSFPGITNKILAGRVQKICVDYDHMDMFFPAEKIVKTGNPVRKDIIETRHKKNMALEFFGFKAGKPVLLVIGGSLGAKTINDSIYGYLDKLIENDIQVIWQTGRLYFPELEPKVQDFKSVNIRLLDFLREMDLAYAAADVVISRAGALSVSEICLAQKPVIFVPSPNVSEDHQTKNAMSLVEKNAARIIKDDQARDKLVIEAIELLNNENERKVLIDNIAKLAKPNATEEIVKEIVKLIH